MHAHERRSITTIVADHIHCVDHIIDSPTPLASTTDISITLTPVRISSIQKLYQRETHHNIRYFCLRTSTIIFSKFLCAFKCIPIIKISLRQDKGMWPKLEICTHCGLKTFCSHLSTKLPIENQGMLLQCTSNAMGSWCHNEARVDAALPIAQCITGLVSWPILTS